MSGYLYSQTDYLLFIEGLTLLVLGALCHFIPERNGGFKLPWNCLGWFAVLYGLTTWLDLVAMMAGENGFLSAARATANLFSFILLFEFARGAASIKTGRLIYLPLFVLLLVRAGTGWPDRLPVITILPALLGGLGSAFLAFKINRSQEKSRELALTGLLLAAFAFTKILLTFFACDYSIYAYIRYQDPSRTGGGALLQLASAVIAIFLLFKILAILKQPAANNKFFDDLPPGTKFYTIAWTAALIVLGLGWIGTGIAGRLAEAELQQNLLSRVKTAAVAMDPERVKKLGGTPDDTGKSEFKQLRTQLAAIREANPSCRFTYLFGLKDGRVVFLADAEPEDSPDYSPPGQVYDEASEKLTASFAEGEAFIEGPASDRWGVWVSGLAPVIDGTDGRVVAVLGLDIDAAEWPRRIAAFRTSAIFSTLILFLTAMFFVSMRYNKRAALQAASSEKRLLESEERYRLIFNNGNDAILVNRIKDNGYPGEYVEVNNVACERLGYSKEEFFDLSPLDIETTGEPGDYQKIIKKLHSDKHVLYESEYKSKSGNKTPVEINAHLFEIKGHPMVMSIARDITERKRIEEQLKYLATHDSLTNIPNRFFLEETLKRSVAKAKRGQKSALLLIDLDNFKLVNDLLGHAAGDEMLITLVKILKNNLREGDLLARLGGDEFAVLIEGASVEEALHVAEKLRRVIDEEEIRLAMSEAAFNLSLSIGVAIIDGTLDYQKLLSRADTALYSAKDEGRNKVVLLDPEEKTEDKLKETNNLVSLIKDALRENRFILLFQPIVGITDGVVRHYETLIRLKDKNGKIISPGSFIPTAERFGLMPQIDRWVVQSSLNILAQYPSMKLYVNISGVSMGDESLLELIETIIRESAIDPSRLGFEITETAAVKDLVRAERWIRRLKSLGCGFALDDFGTGFSSFSYLRMLPVDFLKIDGTYMRNLDTEPVQQALIQAMNTVAHTLGKKTVVEYIENESALELLKTMNIDYGQGYHLGHPIPIHDVITGAGR
ncbi:MAG: EAL domain-containing protein [Firmicutes bacterium]|nr:EAL domain-containing protein [Bacillota bacterium]